MEGDVGLKAWFGLEDALSLLLCLRAQLQDI